jgi:hypothetical protein
MLEFPSDDRSADGRRCCELIWAGSSLTHVCRYEATMAVRLSDDGPGDQVQRIAPKLQSIDALSSRRDILLADGDINLDRDLLGTRTIGNDVDLSNISINFLTGLLDGDLNVAAAGTGLVASRRGVGNRLQATLHRPSTVARIGDRLVDGFVLTIFLSI